ncbi:molybdopterin molybdotransferase MoeA [Companilactobacillus sp.]|jgi:molybdopterin molybdotransferase|uniref:molybdopterin molybdotransferase MoeA n=1 Tax=Companilactobacillus sp. TaxID=2767905 RepID=UPI0025B8B07A|nr:molybdopterin molybdotransferase MoeA [Companilactobacillus sp.]MCH4009250.1 molybdopterin molybdotransferase MoeA [Companilactobacillus sp.]MCH4050571.1 molybdopterin molybdotransferase MoeA [Companilactobacillus sp.]MCH4077192.1 molybdopterin molybdotransferase MoeA [Companilactobacillus sp.]MCH4125768.1 molybdopterin molybdotransferase MoeA [Companilactobacillus sp.]MCI1311477.1 molybdopterin molybdotransferase MoeA [Companilactobacillus sp.]
MYTPVDNRNAISIDAARKLIEENIQPLTLRTEEIKTSDANHRVIAEDVKANHDLPTFRRSGYDGFACLEKDLDKFPVQLKVVGDIPAGANFDRPLVSGEAVRIMTGGYVPDGADVVVMLETTKMLDDDTLEISERQKRDNITQIGTFFKQGDTLLAKNTEINPGGISLLSAFDIQTITVYKKPRVGIITTGSELLQPGDEIVNGKIFNSNGPLIKALCQENGAEVVGYTQIKDDPELLKNAISDLQGKCDVILTDGGVSVGDFDIIADLAKSADKMLFNKLEMRPGSVTTSFIDKGIIYFGLSGNPGACFTGFYLYVEYALRLLEKQQSRCRQCLGTLNEEYTKTNMYDRILRGQYRIDQDHIEIGRVGGDQSDNLNNLQRATCLFEIPRGDSITPKGSVLRTWLLPFK